MRIEIDWTLRSEKREEHKQPSTTTRRDCRGFVEEDTASGAATMKKVGCCYCGQKYRQIRQAHDAEKLSLLRCSGCKIVSYCSEKCQSSDWIRRHRKQCRVWRQQSSLTESHKGASPNIAAREAWKELSAIVFNSSVRQAHELQQKAEDQVARELEKERVKPRSTSTRKSDSTRDAPAEKPSSKLSQPVDEILSRRANSVQLREAPHKKPVVIAGPSLSYYVEHIINLSSYQILLRINEKSSGNDLPLRLEELHVEAYLTQIPYDSTRPTDQRKNEREIVLRVKQVEKRRSFESQLALGANRDVSNSDLRVCKNLVDDGHTLSIRIYYGPQSSLLGQGSYLSTVDRAEQHMIHRTPKNFGIDQANSLACRHCDQSLFTPSDSGAESKRINKILAMPSHNFDGLDDYLICFPGQAAVQFGALGHKVQPGKLLVDDTSFVVHEDSVVPGTVCMLCIPAYGEASRDIETMLSPAVEPGESDDNANPSRHDGLSFSDDSAVTRGGRLWKESLGGSTLSCSCCASVLGVAPIEQHATYRLFQHQLTASFDTIAEENEPARSVAMTVAQFVAHEMLRYAETRAVLTFKCICEDKSESRALLLRLVGWSTKFASSAQDKCLLSSSSVHKVTWYHGLKLLYHDSVVNEHDPLQSGQWTWSGQDWCCRPEMATSQEGSMRSNTMNTRGDTPNAHSYVQIVLPVDDLSSLVEEIRRYSDSFSSDLVSASASAHVANWISGDAERKIGMSVIPLQAH